MVFPRAALAASAELPAGAFDGLAAAAGVAEDDPGAGGAAAIAADAPPTLLT